MSGEEELIARLEKLSGWDQRMDADIAEACGWRQTSHSTGASAGAATWQAPDGSYHYAPPIFTASVDAALTLLPDPNWDHAIEFKCGIGWYAYIKAPDLSLWETKRDMKSAAIALCIAALKARSSKDGERDAVA